MSVTADVAALDGRGLLADIPHDDLAVVEASVDEEGVVGVEGGGEDGTVSREGVLVARGHVDVPEEEDAVRGGGGGGLGVARAPPSIPAISLDRGSAGCSW